MFVVIIEYELRPGVEAEFQEALAEMLLKVKEVDGFLGEEPCRSVVNDLKRVTISYWRDEAALKAWQTHPDHMRVKLLGRKKLLAWYRIRIARIERDYGVPASQEAVIALSLSRLRGRVKGGRAGPAVVLVVRLLGVAAAVDLRLGLAHRLDAAGVDDIHGFEAAFIGQISQFPHILEDRLKTGLGHLRLLHQTHPRLLRRR